MFVCNHCIDTIVKIKGKGLTTLISIVGEKWAKLKQAERI